MPLSPLSSQQSIHNATLVQVAEVFTGKTLRERMLDDMETLGREVNQWNLVERGAETAALAGAVSQPAALTADADPSLASGTAYGRKHKQSPSGQG